MSDVQPKIPGEAKSAIPSPGQDCGWVIAEESLEPCGIKQSSRENSGYVRICLSTRSNMKILMTVKFRMTLKMLFPQRI